MKKWYLVACLFSSTIALVAANDSMGKFLTFAQNGNWFRFLYELIDNKQAKKLDLEALSKELLKDKPIDANKAYEEASSLGIGGKYVELLARLNIPPPENILNQYIFHPFAKLLLEAGGKPTTQTLTNAIKYAGPLDAIEMIINAGIKPTTQTLRDAIKTTRGDTEQRIKMLVKAGAKATDEVFEDLIYNYGPASAIQALLDTGEKPTSPELYQKLIKELPDFWAAEYATLYKYWNFNETDKEKHEDAYKLYMQKIGTKPSKQLSIAKALKKRLAAQKLRQKVKGQ